VITGASFKFIPIIFTIIAACFILCEIKAFAVSLTGMASGSFFVAYARRSWNVQFSGSSFK